MFVGDVWRGYYAEIKDYRQRLRVVARNDDYVWRRLKDFEDVLVKNASLAGTFIFSTFKTDHKLTFGTDSSPYVVYFGDIAEINI